MELHIKIGSFSNIVLLSIYTGSAIHPIKCDLLVGIFFVGSISELISDY